MSKSINVGQPLFNNIEGHPFVLGPQGPYRTKEKAIQALIQFYETRDDIPNGQECIIAGVKFIWRGDDLYESLAVKTINENQTDLNFYRSPGTYRFNSIRNNNFANLPINNNNSNASITGELVVYSSVEGTTTYRSIIGQVLFLSNAEGHETKIYTRSANKTSKDGGATYEVTWGDWQVCQGMKEVGLVSSYDSFIDNGMYSGVYNNNGIIETFVLITINDYVIKSQLGATKSVSQFKYSINAIKSKVKVEFRIAVNDPLEWGEWSNISDGGNLISCTYTELKTLIDNKELIPGSKYRITDYVTTTSQPSTKALNRPFDIIVEALTEDTLSEDAKVCLHDGDTYFSNNDLNAWEIKYCFKNDTTRFAWADTTNGKGVIYYLKDEYKNECWYDFKNIQFLRSADFFNVNSFLPHLEGDNYYYTFSKIYNDKIIDISIYNESNTYAINNSIGVRGQTQRKLTDIIFINSSSITRNNIIGDSSYSCTFGNECHDNIIADYCYNNVIGNEFKNNHIKQLFTNNKVTGTFQYNTLGIQCYNNNFSGYIWFTTFGSQFNYCSFNIPESSKLEHCEFGSGIGFLNGIPPIRKVTFENNVAWYDSTTYVSNLETIDGRTLAEAITVEHDDQLYVYKTGDKYGITSFAELQNSALPSLISNPGTLNDNANGYGYIGTLQNLNVFGDIILIDTLSLYVRNNHISRGVNIDTPIWCRLYKFVNNVWELVYQSSTSIKQRNYSSGDLISFNMRNKSNSTIKSSDKIAIIYSNTDDISIFSSINWGTKSTRSRGGGLNNALNTSSTGATNYQPGIVVNYISMADTPINIVDNLTSTESNKALSANQGKVLDEKINTKQPILESGTNVKTINNQSILGPGNIQIKPGITEEEKKELNDKIDTKAPKVGYAPDLKVNFAKELVGRGEATEQVIGGIRPTGEISIGDGNAIITKIKGNSVVWNQWVKDMQPANLTKRPSFIDGVCTLVAEQDIEAGTYIGGLANTQTKAKVGEKWLYTCSNPNVYIGDAWQYGQVPGRYFSGYYLSSTYSVADIHQTGFYLKNGLKAGTYTFNVGIHNLTLMFGAGNEPTTIEDFEARKPLGVNNEYNEGTIVSYDGDALKSVGFNAYNGEYAKVIGGKKYHTTGTTSVSFAKELGADTTAITLDSEGKFIPEEDGYVFAEGKDIVIHLTHSYTPEHVDEYEEDVHPLPDVKSILDANGNQLFPNGLLSAGSVHDEITATKAIKRVGVVDMGTLNWGAFKHGFTTYSVIPASSSGIEKKLICAQYLTYTPKEIYNNQALVGIAGPQSGYWGGFFLADSKYSTGQEVKQAMSGVLLYYELAEPIEVDLPEPLNMTYEAWDFGTEELVAKGATTPLNADIVYQFNALDRIRENSSAIDALEEHVEERKNDGIKLLDNGNLELTLKGETREFIPATPSGDPMHYAYEAAGAEYNATTNFIVKDAPWKDMVDTIEDKAKWGFDVVDASQVKQMTIGGTTYNYVQTTRQSPENTVEPRYFLVGKGSNGVWVEDETKVLHLPGHWYLNGLGDITGKEILPIYRHYNIVKELATFRVFQITKLRTFFPLNSSWYSQYNSSPVQAFCHATTIEAVYILSKVPLYTTLYPADRAPIINATNGFTNAYALRYIPQHRVKITNEQTYKSSTKLHVVPVVASEVSLRFNDLIQISKNSILYIINNAAPTTPITITLHADRYSQLLEDADIVAALEAKNTALDGTGGSVSLVSA